MTIAFVLISSAATAVFFAVTWLLTTTRHRRSGVRLPPGPRGIPLLGNIFDISSIDGHLAYFELAKKYGPIMQLRTLSRVVVVVSDLKIANDLLDKRGAIYSDRPPYHMADAVGYGWDIANMGHTEAWRVRRRLVHQTFSANGTAQMHGIIRQSCIKLARNLLRTPDNFRRHIRLSAAANIMKAIYGITVADENDTYIHIAEKGLEVINQLTMPGSTPVDQFPFLLRVPEWVPFFGQWTKRVRALRKYPKDMIEVPYSRTMDDINQGLGKPCMVTENLELIQEDHSVTEQVIKDACAVSYLGGSDTTVEALLAFVMAMVLWPEYQKKAQQELDRVVGDRLPDFSDQASLPYIEAIIMETYRKFPVAPLALPHAVGEDDTYQGMLFKKGTIIIANVWAMMLDETAYPDAHKFNPDRWMKGGEIDRTVQDPRLSGYFGYGRRICPGRYFADASVYLTVATALKCFDFGRYVENGVEFPPSGGIPTGIVSSPAPFKCTIKPRSESVLPLLDAASAMYDD